TNVYHQVLERVSNFPGVETVGAVTGYPGSPSGFLGLGPPKASGQKAEEGLMATLRACSPNYFRVMRVPLVAGRFFNDEDTITSRKVIVVNQTLAKRLWPNDTPLGKQLTLPAYM